MCVRSGIIPYCVIDKIKYYILFIDAKYGSIIDGGGHIEKEEYFIDAAVRELKEESLNIFDYSGRRNLEILSECRVITDNYSTFILPNIDIESIDELNDLCIKFRRLFLDCLNRCNPNTVENSYMIWITENDLKKVANGRNVILPMSLRKLINLNITIPTKGQEIDRFSKGLYYPFIYPKIEGLITHI